MVERPGTDVQRPSRAGIGRIVAGSMAAGLVVAVALVAAPFIPARADVLTGVVLLGFAVGWALLAVLSVRFSDHPQRWAAAPAVFLTVAGLISLLGPDTVVGHGFRLGVATGAARARGVEHHPGSPADARAEPGGGWSTRCWPGWACPRSAAATRPYASRSTQPPTPCPVS